MRFIEVKAEEIAKNAKKYDGKEVVINSLFHLLKVSLD